MYLERFTLDSAVWQAQGADHLSRYLHACNYVKGRRVIDAGSGVGYGSALLKLAGAATVVGVEKDESTTEESRRRFGSLGIDFRVGDCEALDIVAGPADVVCSFENIEHLERPEAFVAAAARALSPGGLLLCSTPDRQATASFVDGRPRNPYHFYEWYTEEFREILAHHFDDVEMQAQVRAHRVDLAEQALWSLRSQLRANPLWFLKRWLLERAGRPWTDLDWLAVPTPGDFPIVPAGAAAIFGKPYCHFASCRRPHGPLGPSGEPASD